METTRVDIDALATRFLECTPPLDADGKRISIALYRLLAEGEPVLTGELATKVGLDETGVQELLRSLYSDVFSPGRSNGSRRGRVRNFCHFVHFFRSPEAANRWLEKHPGHLILSSDDALELARKKNALQYGELG